MNCALDGLLLPRLARTDGTLTTLDPSTGQTLTVELATTGTHTTSHAPAVLALGVAGGSDDVHACACPHINLFVDRPALDRWQQQHPSVATLALTLAQAIGLADRLAGDGPPITLA